MSIKTGGSAFPEVAYKQPEGGGTHIMTICGGMTLRDYFAAKALTGLLAAKHEWPETSAGLAKWAYSLSDAMIAVRDKE